MKWSKPSLRMPSLRKGKIYIFPTGTGLVFLLGTVLVILAGASYNNNLVFMLGFFLLAIFIISMVETHANLRGITVESGQISDQFAEVPLVCNLRLINQSRSSRQMITLSSEASKLGHGDSVLVEEIKSQTSLLRSLVFSPMKRGIHSIPLMTVSTIFPLGLFRAWMRVDPNGRVIVYPNPSGHLPLNLRAKDDEGGDLRDQAGGIQHGDEFRDYRRYSYGDSYHRVDWKVFARRRKLMIKEFEGEARRRISIRFEDAPLGDLEVILSQLSRWLELAKEKGSPYELVLPNKKITFGSGHQHYQKCQRELAHFGILS